MKFLFEAFEALHKVEGTKKSRSINIHEILQ